MKNNLWDYNEWQGRSKKQVDNNHKLMFWTIVVGIVVVGFSFIYWLLNSLI